MSLFSRIVDNVVAVAAAPLFTPDNPCRNALVPWPGGRAAPAGDAAFAVAAADFLAQSASDAGRLGNRDAAGLGIDLARQVAGDLTAARVELEKWAAGRGVDLPQAAPPSPLSGMVGETAAQLEGWLIRMNAEHGRWAERFEAATRCDDPDLAAFAARWSPILAEHGRMARHLLEAGETHKDGKNHRKKE